MPIQTVLDALRDKHAIQPVRRLGEGAFGEVWEVEKEGIPGGPRIRCAVKIVQSL